MKWVVITILYWLFLFCITVGGLTGCGGSEEPLAISGEMCYTSPLSNAGYACVCPTVYGQMIDPQAKCEWVKQ